MLCDVTTRLVFDTGVLDNSFKQCSLCSEDCFYYLEEKEVSSEGLTCPQK